VPVNEKDLREREEGRQRSSNIKKKRSGQYARSDDGMMNLPTLQFDDEEGWQVFLDATLSSEWL